MKELIKKISEAKKEIGSISKDSENPFFKSKYFDINQLLEHVEPQLEKHGLLVLQPIKDGKVYSIIYDIETGVNIESSIELASFPDPQKLGSAITYYRRYTLQSLLGLQAEDDDGNKASKKPTKKAEPVATIVIALKDVEAVTNEQQRTDVWNKYKQFWGDESFKKAISLKAKPNGKS